MRCDRNRVDALRGNHPKMTSPITALVRRLESIGDLSDRARQALADMPMQTKRLRKGAEIVADGEVSQTCCLVVEGYVYRSKSLPNGNRQIFSLHPAGDVPDLHSLHLTRMDHNLAAMSDCEVAHFSHAAVAETQKQAPELTDLLWRTTLIDAAAFRAWLLMLGQAEANSRMAHVFCEQFTKAAMAGLNQGESFPFPLTQNDLADVLGISLVHANRTLQELRSRGLMEFDHQKVTILKWDELRELGQFDPSYLHYLDPKVGLTNPAKL
jgi:CRP-like cAMP-binding protein